MKFDDSGRSRPVILVALIVATVAVAAVAGLAFGAMDTGSDERTGEEVLSDVSETYTDAESVSSDAVVTVEVANTTTEFEVSAATAGANQTRFNVSHGEFYVLTGVDGETAWRYDSVTGLTGVLDRNGNTLTASLRAGTETPARSGLSALPGDIGLDTELSTVLDAFDGELPDGIDGQLDDLPANVTVGAVLANDSLAAGINDDVLADAGNGPPGDLPAFEFPANLSEYELPEDWEDYELPEEWAEFEFPANLSEFEFPANHSGFEFPANLSEYELPEDWEEYKLPEKWAESEFPANISGFEFPANHSGYELPEDWEEYELPANLSEYDLPEDWEDSNLSQRVEALLTGKLNRSAVTVERVGTTTVDGTEANELLLTYPGTESETRLWTSVESDTVLRQETTAPGLTVTVDVQETRFGVSPTDSTFEPPGASELASLSVSTAGGVGEFETATPFEAAVPGDDWRFERGAVLSGSAPSLTAISEVAPTDIAASAYTDGESSVVVSQSNVSVDWDRLPLFGTETVTIGDREVELLASEYASVGMYSEDGTTVVVAGAVSGQQLRSVIAGIELAGGR